MSYELKIYSAKEGEPVVNIVLRITGRNILNIPSSFELVDLDQTTDISDNKSEFVVVTAPAHLFQDRQFAVDNGEGEG